VFDQRRRENPLRKGQKTRPRNPPRKRLEKGHRKRQRNEKERRGEREREREKRNQRDNKTNDDEGGITLQSRCADGFRPGFDTAIWAHPRPTRRDHHDSVCRRHNRNRSLLGLVHPTQDDQRARRRTDGCSAGILMEYRVWSAIGRCLALTANVVMIP
jgi:hypothetical protein